MGAGERHVERQKKGEGKGPRCTGRMGLEVLFSDQHMCVFVCDRGIGEGV